MDHFVQEGLFDVSVAGDVSHTNTHTHTHINADTNTHKRTRIHTNTQCDEFDFYNIPSILQQRRRESNLYPSSSLVLAETSTPTMHRYKMKVYLFLAWNEIVW